MLVDHLLLAIGDQDNHKAVKAGDHPPELKTIHQKQRYGNPFPLYSPLAVCTDLQMTKAS